MRVSFHTKIHRRPRDKIYSYSQKNCACTLYLFLPVCIFSQTIEELRSHRATKELGITFGVIFNRKYFISVAWYRRVCICNTTTTHLQPTCMSGAIVTFALLWLMAKHKRRRRPSIHFRLEMGRIPVLKTPRFYHWLYGKASLPKYDQYLRSSVATVYFTDWKFFLQQKGVYAYT